MKEITTRFASRWNARAFNVELKKAGIKTHGVVRVDSQGIATYFVSWTPENETQKEKALNILSYYNEDQKQEEKKMKIGATIIINAWGKFPERTMKCVGIKYDEKYKADRFVFDNGVEWTESNLQANFELWKSRNGYRIIE